MITIIKQDTGFEANSGYTMKTFQSGKNSWHSRFRGFDFNREKYSHVELDDHIELHFVFIAVVADVKWLVHLNYPLTQFIVDKEFQQ